MKVSLQKLVADIKYAERIRMEEFRGLVKFMSDYGLKNGLVITKEHEAEETIEGFKIRLVPLWKWLLEDLENYEFLAPKNKVSKEME
ncbi:MAG: hypothetical protein QME12_07520 [Nanoarchaeota archaeon]|nr:hypothetical protein [Nanoarchaeota archaeon]